MKVYKCKGKVEKYITMYVEANPRPAAGASTADARDAGCHYVYEHGERAGQRSVRAAWIASLRPGDTAWLPDVRCLLLPAAERGDDYSPTADLAATTNHLLATGATIADARAGVSSAEPAKWAAHMLAATRKAANGERSQASVRKALNKAREAVGPGIKARWHAPAMARELARQRAIWTGAGGLESIREHLHPELAGCSTRTLYDVLGVRRPDDPRAGGRGKTRGSR